MTTTGSISSASTCVGGDYPRNDEVKLQHAGRALGRCGMSKSSTRDACAPRGPQGIRSNGPLELPPLRAGLTDRATFLNWQAG